MICQIDFSSDWRVLSVPLTKKKKICFVWMGLKLTCVRPSGCEGRSVGSWWLMFRTYPVGVVRVLTTQVIVSQILESPLARENDSVVDLYFYRCFILASSSVPFVCGIKALRSAREFLELYITNKIPSLTSKKEKVKINAVLLVWEIFLHIALLELSMFIYNEMKWARDSPASSILQLWACR